MKIVLHYAHCVRIALTITKYICKIKKCLLLFTCVHLQFKGTKRIDEPLRKIAKARSIYRKVLKVGKKKFWTLQKQRRLSRRWFALEYYLYR